MRKIYIFFCVILLQVVCFGQEGSKIDSLKLKLDDAFYKEDRLKILVILSKELSGNSNIEYSKNYFEEMYDLADESNDVSLKVLADIYISDGYMKNHDFENSEKYALRALNQKGDKEDKMRGFNQLGRVYDRFGSFEKAISAYKKGIEIGDKMDPIIVLATLYSNMGTAYIKLNNPEKGIDNFIFASKIANTLNDYQNKAYYLYSIGNAYTGLEQYDKAEKYFLEGLKDSLYLGNDIYKYMIHHSRGINFSRNYKFDEAFNEYKKSLKYFRQTEDKLYEFDALNNISTVFNRMENHEKALDYASQALKIAEEINHARAIVASKLSLAANYISLGNPDIAANYLRQIIKDTIDPTIVDKRIKSYIFGNLALVHKDKKEYKQALYYTERFKSLSDSLLKKQRDSNIAEIETRYQTEKKEKENLQLRQEKAVQELNLAKENRNKWLFGGGLAASLAVLGITGFYYRRNQRQKRVIENLQKELHHRIKNNLAIIDTFIEVAKEEFPNKKFENKLSELQSRIESINEVHRQLYQNKDITSLNIQKYIATLAENISQSFSDKEVAIEVNIPDNLQVSAGKSFPVGLIVNEFLTNSFKYAFDGSQKGKINIDITEKDKNYIISLSDNGKGLPANFDIENSQTFGLRIIKLLTKQLKGSFDLKNEDGVKINVKFADNQVLGDT